jgi:hypothetical protein
MFIRTFLILLIFLNSSAFSADVKDKLLDKSSGKIAEYVSNLIPGEGQTEVSIDLRENHSADFSILAVREIEEYTDGNLFTQFSLSKTEQNNDDRIVANLGLGKRMLSDDKHMMSGINAFLDYDDAGNARASLGAEAKNVVLDFSANYYQGLDNAKDEKVLDGYDLSLTSQIPYLHWADAFVSSYKWKGIDRDDIEGTKLGSEMFLTSTLSLELAYDNKDKKGLEDEWYANLQFFYPPRKGATAQDGISNLMWKEEKDMSDQLLTKVKRQKKIMIEFKGSGTISRLD